MDYSKTYFVVFQETEFTFLAFATNLLSFRPKTLDGIKTQKINLKSSR